MTEGFSDALTRLSKLAGEPLPATLPGAGRLATGGYLDTAIPSSAMTTALWQVTILLVIAWISHGIGLPRPAMLLTCLALA